MRAAEVERDRGAELPKGDRDAMSKLTARAGHQRHLPVESLAEQRPGRAGRPSRAHELVSLRRPVPVRNGADWMQVGVGLGPRVLLRDSGAKLYVLAERLTERLVDGQARFVERLHVRRDEPFALLVGDVQVPVDIDDVREAEPACEAIRSAERLGR